jgi:hypothetical protein
VPIPSSPAPWWGSLIWLLVLAAAAFGVAWLSGTRLHIGKPFYIPLLFVVTAGVSGGYIAWLGLDATDVITNRWAWGVVAAAVSGVLLTFAAFHQPVDRPVHGRQRAVAVVWEGAVYGTAEGVLLSALPPFMAWQMVHSLGWSGIAGSVARWTLPILSAAVVIVIHHLGYWSCRNRILVPITLALSTLTAGFLLTASWIAPALGHVFLHLGLVVRGVEMPPHHRPADVARLEQRDLDRAA